MVLTHFVNFSKVRLPHLNAFLCLLSHYLVSWRKSRRRISFSFTMALISQERFSFSSDFQWSIKNEENKWKLFFKKERKRVCATCAISQTGTPTWKQWMNQWCDVVWLGPRLNSRPRPDQRSPAPPIKRHRLTGVNAQREREREGGDERHGRRPVTSPSAAPLNGTTNLNRSRQAEPSRRRKSRALLESLSGSLRGHGCYVIVAD